MGYYALYVHNLAARITPSPIRTAEAPRLLVLQAPLLRRAQLVDVLQLCALVNGYAVEKLMLPRTTEQIALEQDNYIVAVDAGGRVMACAALYEYSPSVAEIASVAVDREYQGRGLGTDVVRAAEQVARLRGFERVFAMSLAIGFFESLGYSDTPLDTYPEKVNRYEELEAAGVQIVPKRCFEKTIGERAELSAG